MSDTKEVTQEELGKWLRRLRIHEIETVQSLRDPDGLYHIELRGDKSFFQQLLTQQFLTLFVKAVEFTEDDESLRQAVMLEGDDYLDC